LAQQVYGLHKSISDKQPEYYSEILNVIEEPSAFEDGSKRKNGTWSNISFQNVLGNLDSRSRVAALFEDNNDYCLFLRWDFGMSGEPPVNKLSFDPLLPQDYLYVSDYNSCDEGYADMWVGVPSAEVKRFRELYEFAFNCLTLKNDFYNLMTEDGWICSYENNTSSVWALISSRLKFRQIKNAVIQKLDFVRQSESDTLVFRIIRRFFRTILHILTLPKIQAEYYSMGDVREARFSKIQALNIHAIFKYFLYVTGLRDKLRFCHPSDVFGISRGVRINSRVDELCVVGELPKAVDEFILNAISHWMIYENISSLYVVKARDATDMAVGFPGVYFGRLSSETVCSIVSLTDHERSGPTSITAIEAARVGVYKYVQT
jgi:hypothetical protein